MTSRDQPIFKVPPNEIKATNVLNVDARSLTDPANDEVNRCLEREAGRIAIPAPKDRDTLLPAHVHRRQPLRNATVTPSPPSFGSPARNFSIALCVARCVRIAVRSAPVP